MSSQEWIWVALQFGTMIFLAGGIAVEVRSLKKMVEGLLERERERIGSTAALEERVFGRNRETK